MEDGRWKRGEELLARFLGMSDDDVGGAVSLSLTVQ